MLPLPVPTAWLLLRYYHPSYRGHPARAQRGGGHERGRCRLSTHVNCGVLPRAAHPGMTLAIALMGRHQVARRRLLSVSLGRPPDPVRLISVSGTVSCRLLTVSHGNGRKCADFACHQWRINALSWCLGYVIVMAARRGSPRVVRALGRPLRMPRPNSIHKNKLIKSGFLPGDKG